MSVRLRDSSISQQPEQTKRLKTDGDLTISQSCPYLDTIDRRVLDFDFEKVCSVTLQNHNVYGCLVCGKFFQGRGHKSPAYTHSVAMSHHVFINLHSGRVYCLPDDYEVQDPSLSDIQYTLAPKYSKEDVEKLSLTVSGDSEQEIIEKLSSRALDGTEYIPGLVGLNNLNQTDCFNVIIQCLNNVKPLRDFFIVPENYSSCKSSLVQAFGELIRKLWNPKNFKSHVSPHEFLQAISKESEKKFKIGENADPILFLSWFLNTLHRHLLSSSQSKKKVKNGKGSSIITDIFQGVVEMIEEDVHKTGVAPRLSEIPFFYLSLKLPNNPLFRDERERDVIPQVPLFALLAKFDGETIEYGTTSRNGTDVTVSKRYRIKSLPKYLILHYSRFSKNRFFIEKNPVIVNFPVSDLDASPYVLRKSRELGCKYNLVGNVVHETQKKEEVENSATMGMDQMKGAYRAHILNQRSNPAQWLEIQDLHVRTILAQLVALSESYIQFWQKV